LVVWRRGKIGELRAKQTAGWWFRKGTRRWLAALRHVKGTKQKECLEKSNAEECRPFWRWEKGNFGNCKLESLEKKSRNREAGRPRAKVHREKSPKSRGRGVGKKNVWPPMSTHVERSKKAPLGGCYRHVRNRKEKLAGGFFFR